MASSSEPNPIPPPEGTPPEPELSKKAAKQEKLRKKQESAVAAAAAAVAEVSIDPLADNYGYRKWNTGSGNMWTDVNVKALSPALNGTKVLIRGRVHTVRAVSKKMSFLVVRNTGTTVQCVISVKPGYVSQQMVKFSNSLHRESIVNVFGIVSVPNVPIMGTTQEVEIQVSKLYGVSEAATVLPINIEDAARSEAEIDEALKYSKDTLRLTFEKGVQMLKEAGTEVDPFGDLNTETEKKLGELVREKYDTEFFILHRYPLAIRPFYTMPCDDDPNYSNSFDVFIRGEEIISGAQRIHDPVLLEERAKACGIDVGSISSYLDAFKYGVWPHGGFGVGLERVVKLYCNLDDIRMATIFPRDPNRLEP